MPPYLLSLGSFGSNRGKDGEINPVPYPVLIKDRIAAIRSSSAIVAVLSWGIRSAEVYVNLNLEILK
jgi:hypothetical protein